MVLPLVQAYVGCNANPDCESERSLEHAECADRERRARMSAAADLQPGRGWPPNGWFWGPKGAGTVSFKAAPSRIQSALNPPFDTADVTVKLDLADVQTAVGPANAYGTLLPVRRTTFKDRVNGDMTVIDLAFPSFQVHVVNGKARVGRRPTWC